MSVKNVENFYLMVKRDIELKEKLEQIKKKLETEKKEVSLDDLEQKIISLAHKYDCDFTKEELDAYLEKVKSQMSEEELLKISAGISKRLAVLGLSGALITSIGTGFVLNAGLNKFEIVQEQQKKAKDRKDELRKKIEENRRIKDQEKNKKNKNSTLIFKASAK